MDQEALNNSNMMNGSTEQYINQEIARFALEVVDGETEQEDHSLQARATTTKTPAMERNTTDSSLSDADSLPKQQQEQKQLRRLEEKSHVDVEDIDADTDVLLDNMEAGTPKRRIFRQVVEEYAPRYRFMKRGQKKAIVEEAVQVMKNKGVRFLETDHSGDHFGRRLAYTTCTEKIFEKVRRCFREINRQKDREWCSASSSMALSSAASTANSSIRTTPTTFGGSVASAFARSSPPIIQVTVPMPPPSITTTKKTKENEAKEPASMTSLEDLSVTQQVSLASSSRCSSSAKFPPSCPSPPLLVPTGQMLDKGEATTDSTMIKCYSNEQEGIVNPPSLERGLESWFSLVSQGGLQRVAQDGGLQRLFQEEETFDNAHNNDNTTSIIKAGDDGKLPPAAKRSLDFFEFTPQRAAQRRRVSESSTEQQTHENVPTWAMHLTQHVVALQHRLEMVERDNVELRRLVEQQGFSPLPQLPSEESFDDPIWNLVSPSTTMTTSADNSISNDELPLALTFQD